MALDEEKAELQKKHRELLTWTQGLQSHTEATTFVRSKGEDELQSKIVLR